MKSKKIKPLSDFEWTLCWMAIRYAMGRRTIASAMLPSTIIREYYHRFSELQKKKISRDLLDYLSDREHFGDKNIDDTHWKRFLGILNTDGHYKVDLIDGSEITVFKVDDVIYSLDKSIDSPFHNWYIPAENVKRGEK